ncbi:acetylglucosamine transferase [Ideonella sp.]|uniref:O-linked N-acetylglucosamine transferase, SPINDLY family protein n=1 Tax=Ideonella sp. TaxID=1929293 RepID=UPI0037BED764
MSTTSTLQAPGSSHATPTAPDAQQAAALERARAGQMPLNDLLDLAQTWQNQGHTAQAVVLYAEWLAHNDAPLRHVACFNQGTLLAALQRDDEAEAAYAQALALFPNFQQARLNLGHALERKGQPEEALAQWQAVVDTTADTHHDAQNLRLHALNNMARLTETLRRFDQAEALMVKSLGLKAAQFDVLQHYVHIRQKQCEWPVWQPVAQVTRNQLLLGTSPLAMLGASDDPALQLLAAQRFVHDRLPAPPAVPLHSLGPKREGKIKIGYLSGDLCLHAVGLLTPELLELHDRERFEVYGFCWSKDDGTPQRARLIKALDHHVRIGHLDDTTAARLITSLGVDILIDLQGLTNGARPGILVQRPAPVQVSYLGFPGTCGIPGVDYILSDRFVLPPELEPFHTERPLHVPHCYQVSDRQREVAPTPTRAQYGLPEDAFVYCSFNNTFKFTDEVFNSWMKVLKAVPGSVLWLLADNDWARDNMLACALSHGVAPERLIFAPRVSPPEYLARFALADLMLDTFPYNAGTTASDALWMGLPILTLSGRSYISRMAGSLLTAAGLPDLITHTLPHYERSAIRLGQNPGRITSLKRYLAEQGRSSPLFDMPARVRDIEDALLPLAHAARQASHPT